MIQAASNLKAIGRAGTGIDNIDLKVATSKGIPVIKYDYNIMLYIVTLLVFFVVLQLLTVLVQQNIHVL